MIYYKLDMEHSKESFEALAHMQYDLFCMSNRIGRSVISLAAIIGGILNSSHWWAILLIAYGCYMTTSTYSSPNHTAHKLTRQVEASGLGYPKSHLVFYGNEVVITPIPSADNGRTTLSYQDILRLGEDFQYFYFFRDRFGGYMVPKKTLGDKSDAFRSFMETATGQKFRSRTAPILRLFNYLGSRKRT